MTSMRQPPKSESWTILLFMAVTNTTIFVTGFQPWHGISRSRNRNVYRTQLSMSSKIDNAEMLQTSFDSLLDQDRLSNYLILWRYVLVAIPQHEIKEENNHFLLNVAVLLLPFFSICLLVYFFLHH